MRHFKGILITGIILVSAIVGITIFFLYSNGSDSGMNKVKFKEVIVERGTFQIIVMANGVVKSIDRIEIKSKASGEIVELPVEEGDFISQGDLIARLDQKDERAEVAQAQADFDIAKAELKQAQSTFERRNQLFQDNLISEEEQGQITLDLAVAKGKVIQASTTLERAQERLSEAVVRAPIDGTILQKYVEEGQIIASGVSNVSGGTPIVDIADMSSVYIETGIDEIDIGKVYENLMIDLQVKNVKLKDRAERIIMTLTGLDRDSADKLLTSANGNVKTAIVMHKLQAGYEEASKKLENHNGFVREVLKG